MGSAAEMLTGYQEEMTAELDAGEIDPLESGRYDPEADIGAMPEAGSNPEPVPDLLDELERKDDETTLREHVETMPELAGATMNASLHFKLQTNNAGEQSWGSKYDTEENGEAVTINLELDAILGHDADLQDEIMALQPGDEPVVKTRTKTDEEGNEIISITTYLRTRDSFVIMTGQMVNEKEPTEDPVEGGGDEYHDAILANDTLTTVQADQADNDIRTDSESADIQALVEESSSNGGSTAAPNEFVPSELPPPVVVETAKPPVPEPAKNHEDSDEQEMGEHVEPLTLQAIYAATPVPKAPTVPNQAMPAAGHAVAQDPLPVPVRPEQEAYQLPRPADAGKQAPKPHPNPAAPSPKAVSPELYTPLPLSEPSPARAYGKVGEPQNNAPAVDPHDAGPSDEQPPMAVNIAKTAARPAETMTPKPPTPAPSLALDNSGPRLEAPPQPKLEPPVKPPEVHAVPDQPAAVIGETPKQDSQSSPERTFTNEDTSLPAADNIEGAVQDEDIDGVEAVSAEAVDVPAPTVEAALEAHQVKNPDLNEAVLKEAAPPVVSEVQIAPAQHETIAQVVVAKVPVETEAMIPPADTGISLTQAKVETEATAAEEAITQAAASEQETLLYVGVEPVEDAAGHTAVDHAAGQSQDAAHDWLTDFSFRPEDIGGAQASSQPKSDPTAIRIPSRVGRLARHEQLSSSQNQVQAGDNDDSEDIVITFNTTSHKRQPARRPAASTLRAAA